MSDRRLPFISLPPSASLPVKCGLDLVSHLSLVHKGLQIIGRIPLIGCLGGQFCGQWILPLALFNWQTFTSPFSIHFCHRQGCIKSFDEVQIVYFSPRIKPPSINWDVLPRLIGMYRHHLSWRRANTPL